LRKKCSIIEGIFIDFIYIGGMVESIILKLKELVVVKMLHIQFSIMNDIKFDDISEEDDEQCL